MDKFIIYCINGFVSVNKIADDGLIIPLKKEGEKEFKYSSDSFWNWFKKKIEYNGENLSFIIISDQNFSIPKDIKIAEKSSFEELPAIKIPPNTKLFTFPKIEKKDEKKIIIKKNNEKNLLDYFLEKTIEMQNKHFKGRVSKGQKK